MVGESLNTGYPGAQTVGVSFIPISGCAFLLELRVLDRLRNQVPVLITF